MVAKKKKRVTKKKKKAAVRKKKPKIAVKGPIGEMTLDMPLDARKIKAIQRCIEKGKLKITVKKVDLASGRLGDAWLYD